MEPRFGIPGPHASADAYARLRERRVRQAMELVPTPEPPGSQYLGMTSGGRSVRGPVEPDYSGTIVNATIPVVYGVRRVVGLLIDFGDGSPYNRCFVFCYGKGGPYPSGDPSTIKDSTDTTMTVLTADRFRGTLSQTPSSRINLHTGMSGRNSDYPGRALAIIDEDKFDAEISEGSTTAVLNGKQITEPWSPYATGSFADNARVAYSILTDLGAYTDAEMDLTAWEEWHDWCIAEGYEFNGTAAIQADALDEARRVASEAFTRIVWHKGKLLPVWDRLDISETDIAEAIPADAWVAPPAYSFVAPGVAPNVIWVKYYEDEDATEFSELMRQTGAPEPDAIVEEEVSLDGCTSATQAETFGDHRLAIATDERWGLTGVVDRRMRDHKPGDICKVSTPDGKLSEAWCRVESVEPLLEGGCWGIKVREYGGDVTEEKDKKT